MKKFASTLAMIAMLVAPTSYGQEIEFAGLPLQTVTEVNIASLDPGIVKVVLVQPGDEVRAGDLLVELDSDLHQAELAAQEANFLAAQEDAADDVSIRYAQKALAMCELILKKGEVAVTEFAESVSQTELAKMRLDRDQAELALEEAQAKQRKAVLAARTRQAELAAAKIRLNHRFIKAPCDGVIVRVDAKVGESVGNGQTVVRLINPSRLRVVASAAGSLFTSVNRNTQARFVLEAAQGSTALPAKIVFISPEIRFTDQSFDIWVEVENSNLALVPGQKGKLILETNTESSPQVDRLTSSADSAAVE